MPRKLRGKKCVGVRKIYNDGSFQRHRSDGESSQQNRKVTTFGRLPGTEQAALELRSQPCISLPWKKHEEVRLWIDLTQNDLNRNGPLFLCLTLTHNHCDFRKQTRSFYCCKSLVVTLSPDIQHFLIIFFFFFISNSFCVCVSFFNCTTFILTLYCTRIFEGYSIIFLNIS